MKSLRKSFSSVIAAGVAAVALLTGCGADRHRPGPDYEQETENGAVYKVYGCVVQHLRYSTDSCHSDYDFDWGRINNRGCAQNISFKDMYTDKAKKMVLDAYEMTQRAGNDCPAPQFASLCK